MRLRFSCSRWFSWETECWQRSAWMCLNIKHVIVTSYKQLCFDSVQKMQRTVWAVCFILNTNNGRDYTMRTAAKWMTLYQRESSLCRWFETVHTLLFPRKTRSFELTLFSQENSNFVSRQCDQIWPIILLGSSHGLRLS